MKISYLGSDFKEWFGSKFSEPKEIKLEFKTLEKEMNDKEILEELKPAEITLNELAYVLENELLFKVGWFICYIKDREKVLRAVYVYCYGDGWYVNADSVENPNRWNAGYQVFSSNFLTSSFSEILPNELNINGVVYRKIK